MVVLMLGCFLEPVGDIPGDQAELDAALLHSVKHASARRTRALIEAGASTSQRDLQGWTPLHYAVNRLHRPNDSQIDAIEALLEVQGIVMNPVANDGSQPMWLAARHGSIPVLEMFASHGADLHSVDSSGFTLLMTAIQHRHIELARHLIDDGAKIEAQLPGGGTALFMAITTRSPDLVHLVLDSGANIHGNDRAAPPIIFAAGMNSTEVVKILLDAGADVNSVNKRNGMTPLHRAIGSGPIMVKLLLDAGAQSGVANTEGITPIDTASQAGDEESVKLLSAAS